MCLQEKNAHAYLYLNFANNELEIHNQFINCDRVENEEDKQK